MKTNTCVDRLVREWRLHNKIIIAVDFDDTVFDYHGKWESMTKRWHESEHEKDVVDVVKEAQEFGAYVVMFTAAPRGLDDWGVQRNHMAALGIRVDSVNANPVELPFGHDGKPYYNILLDDRAGLGQSLYVLHKALLTMKLEAVNV